MLTITSFSQIVGAGPAGISTASALSRAQFPNKNGQPDVRVDITVFEKKDRIGGKIALGPWLSTGDGLSYALQAEDVAVGCLSSSRIIPARLNPRYGSRFGFDTTSGVAESGRNVVGFFDGKEVIADVTRPREDITWGDWLKLIWRYGPSVWRASKLPTGTMDGFNRMMDMAFEAEKGRKSKTHARPWDMLLAGRMVGAASLSAKARLSKNGIEGKYVDEILRAQARRQSGVDIEDLSDLGLSMALEREGIDSCPNKENARMMQELAAIKSNSRAVFEMSTRVTAFKQELVEEGKKKWIVEYTQAGMDGLDYEAFDKVIIAAPWNISSLPFVPIVETQEPVLYKPVWVTIIITKSQLTSKHFGRTPETLPTEILPIVSSPDLPLEFRGIHEITFLRQQRDMNSEEHLRTANLYRVLSDHPLSNATIRTLWEDGVEATYSEEIENAYPITYPRGSSDALGSFQLGDGIWHTSVMDAVGTTMDLAWVAGGNVARLVEEDINHERV